MPARDRTGPLGLGPRTGRGLGPCSVVNKGTIPGAERGPTNFKYGTGGPIGRGLGLGRGRGFGRGRGMGRGRAI